MAKSRQIVLSATRYSPNIQIFKYLIFNIQYWVADSEQHQTFSKYSFIERDQSDDYNSQWPDLYALCNVYFYIQSTMHWARI